MGKHYTTQDIADRAKKLGKGWTKTTLPLEEGDTAVSGTSTKYHWAGPGVVVYYVHGPTGSWNVEPRRVTHAYI